MPEPSVCCKCLTGLQGTGGIRVAAHEGNTAEDVDALLVVMHTFMSRITGNLSSRP